MSQKLFVKACIWSGLITPAFFFIAFVLGHWIPPLSAALSAGQIASHYREHSTGIRVGGVFMMISGMFYAAYTAGISGQMARIRGLHPTVVMAQSIAGAFGCITFMLPGILMEVAAFRPERPATTTQLLNDLVWIVLVMPWPPFMTQNFAFAFAIFSQDHKDALFPRWLGYLNIWAPIIFTPAVMLPFFKSGPFSWNGVFVLWIPATVFVIQFIANVVLLLRAVNVPETPSDEPSRTRPLFAG